jgi:hypothetical protein
MRKSLFSQGICKPPQNTASLHNFGRGFGCSAHNTFILLAIHMMSGGSELSKYRHFSRKLELIGP